MADDTVDIIEVQITLDSAGVESAGFGIALLAGRHNVTINRVDTYANVTEMSNAGFSTYHPLYRAASAYFQQKPKSESVMIGNEKTGATAFFINTVKANQDYTITIDGIDYTYHSIYASEVEILNGLQALIDIVVGLSAAVSANEVLLVTYSGFTTAIPGTYIDQTSYFETIGIDSAAVKLFEVEIDGVAYDYNAIGGDTRGIIAAGLVADINATSHTKYKAYLGSNQVILIGLKGTAFFEVELDDSETDMSIFAHVESNTVVYNALIAASSAFYGIQTTINSPARHIKWAELNEIDDAHFFIYRDNDTDIVDQSTVVDTESTPAVLKVLSRECTAGIYHTKADGSINDEFIDAALFGARLTADLDVQHVTWMFAQLKGVTYDTFTTTQRVNATGTKRAPTSGKNINIFVKDHGLYFVKRGITCSGKYIDTIVGKHWFVARLVEAMLIAFVSNGKIPFDNKGIMLPVSVLRARILASFNVQYGTKDTATFGDQGYDLTWKKREDYTASQRATRLLSDLGWKMSLSGAIHGVIFQGYFAD